MLRFFKRRAGYSEEVEGTTCQWCRSVIAASTSEELFLAGAVLDPLTGWFCSNNCAKQYSVRFHVQPGRTASGGSRTAH